MRCFAYLARILKNCLNSVSIKKKKRTAGFGSIQKKRSKMTKIPHQDLIIVIANKHLLNPNLVAALVQTESSYNSDAVRYEKNYRWTLDPEKYCRPLKISQATELELQKFSWGLMQVMGAVSREHGYTGPLHRLCNPDLGLEYGCLHFAKYFRKYNDLAKAISAYNGGPGAVKSDGSFSNQSYVDKITDRYMSGEIS